MRPPAPLLVAAAALLAACTSRPLPEPDGAKASVIGMRVWVDSPRRGNYGARNQPADGIVLVKLSGKGDPTRVRETIESNFSQGATQYLFNADPGRYAVVACFRRRDGRKVYSYFTEALIRKTIVDLKPKSMAYAGTLRMGVTYNTQIADEAQDHYFRLLDPEFYSMSFLERMIARTDNEMEKRHKLRRDAEAEASFRDRARSLLKGTSWLSRFREGDE